MGRKGGKALRTAPGASCLELTSLADDKSCSTASVVSAFSYLEDKLDDMSMNEMESRLEALFEKRGSTREKALEALTVMLRVDVRIDDCMAHNETLTSRCLNSLKRGSVMESCLAAQLLGLHILTLGQPDERFFHAVAPELERVARGGSGASCCAALDTLALAAFVLAEDEGTTRGLMDRLRALWKKGDAKCRAAAVRGWSFLLTSLDRPLGAAEAVAALGALAALTHDRDMELRAAAGEAAAVLQACCPEALRLAEDEEDGDDDEGEEQAEEGEAAAHDGWCEPEGGHARATNGSANGHANGNGMEELVERMQDLATNKGDKLRRKKRERATQRATFRQLLGAVSGSVAPSCRIKLQHGDSLLVEGLEGVHRLAFFRRFLAGGFQAHLQHNPLLHDVFGFSPRTERPERLTATEKRLTRSCHSAEARARAASRQYSRDAKAYLTTGYHD